MITYHADVAPIAALPGITRRTLATSDVLMLCEFTFAAQVRIPIHTHPHEQVGYVVYGRVEMTIDGQACILGPGDSYCAAGNIPHGALTLEPTMIIDTFTPPREDYRS